MKLIFDSDYVEYVTEVVGAENLDSALSESTFLDSYIWDLSKRMENI